MATSTKTICYAFPVLTSAANNTLTPISPITVYIPESGVSITRAWVDVSMDDIATAGATINARTVDLQLNVLGYSTTTNGNILSTSSENTAIISTRDFTTYFQTNWAGPSMTCDLQVLTNQSTGTTLGMVNICAILYITYEYDDTSSTHIKTVWIPLNAPRTSLPAVKTSHDTIPALDTYLPETSKTYRSVYVVTRANRVHANTTDYTVSYELSSLGVHTTQSYEAALSTDVYTRYVWDITAYITTNTTHTFNVWASVAGRYSCMQAWMVVTYEFDPAATTSVMNSLLLPAEFDSPMGGLTAADYQRSSREFWMPEDNPVIQKIACLVNWNAIASEVGLAARVGTGSFLGYTNTGSGVVAGDKTMMIRNDAPSGLTFQKGRNQLTVDIYNTSNSIRGLNVGCLWIVNYTSDVSPNGISANNKTILWVYTISGGNAQQLITNPPPFSIPETNHFIVGLGYEFKYINNGSFVSQGVTIGVERLASEGGIIWEPAYADAGGHDIEVGVNTKYSQSRSIFKRWNGDYNSNRLDLATARRYRTWIASNVADPAIHESLTGMITYHSSVRTVSGSITGSAGGTVDIYLHRASTGEIVLSTSQIGNGSFSFDWYDDTEDLFVSAYESTTKKGRSKRDVSGSGFDISLGGGEASHTWFG